MGIREDILNAKTALGIEFGSTRIKAVLVDSTNAPIASGSHEWENRLDNGIWTYTLEDIWGGLQEDYTGRCTCFLSAAIIPFFFFLSLS